MLTPAPVSCGSRKLPSPSHPGCRTERLPPSVVSLTTRDVTQSGPAQKGLWLPNQNALQHFHAFSGAKDLEPPLYPQVPPSPGAGLQNGEPWFCGRLCPNHH